MQNKQIFVMNRNRTLVKKRTISLYFEQVLVKPIHPGVRLQSV
jgi:hypothetical protein